MISSALMAGGIKIFGRHHKDGAPQGLFCANGQCSQCMVLADSKPVKACMTPVRPGLSVESCEGKPALPIEDAAVEPAPVPVVKTQCLIIGGGPAGLSAAIELAEAGVRAILVDDKHSLGGKLGLQTHNFFGSRADSYAGTRGIDIARRLEENLRTLANGGIEIWLDSPAVGVFCDGRVGVVRNGAYVLVEPEILLVASGAREKALDFPGSDLPGVYGAGAFQTLVNRDLVRPAERLFICGGGNVGLIAAYHALQAGIEVIGIVEAMPECGGYKVHLDKLKRLGVPVYTSHTVVRASGADCVESVTICGVDESFRPVSGTEKRFMVDTLLIAVGLSPVNEMYLKARQYGMKAFSAGDAEMISEATAAMFSGRIQGRRIARELDKPAVIPQEWDATLSVLRGKPGSLREIAPRPVVGGVYPVIRCFQEIPCDPCIGSCPKGAIRIRDGTLTGLPSFEGERCLGCARCVLACPGLAIMLVNEGYREDKRTALLTLPFELAEERIEVGGEVATVGMEGQRIGTGRVVALRKGKHQDRRLLLLLQVPFEHRLSVAGIRLLTAEEGIEPGSPLGVEDSIICRCERVRKSEIVNLIRAGYRDMNQIKAALRTGMGACGGKNCGDLILRIFREEGVEAGDVTLPVQRPLDREVPLSIFAGLRVEPAAPPE